MSFTIHAHLLTGLAVFALAYAHHAAVAALGARSASTPFGSLDA